MTHRYLAAAALLATFSAHAAVSLPTAAATYTQSFNTLASTGAANAFVNDSTLHGIGLYTTANVPITSYVANSGTSNTGAFYSWGVTDSSERALGGVGSGGFTGYIALSLTNDSGAAFDSFTLRYDGEQWRSGGNTAAQTMGVEYGFGTIPTTIAWTPVPALGWTSPVTGATAASVDGNLAGLAANVGGTVNVTWTPGTTLFVRWLELNDAGNDHGLAIDNVRFSVTAVPEPGTMALWLAGLAAIGLLARRRA